MQKKEAKRQREEVQKRQEEEACEEKMQKEESICRYNPYTFRWYNAKVSAYQQ